MSFKSVIDVIHKMVEDGILTTYAVGGAVAASAYIEAMNTSDMDILIQCESFSKGGLLSITPIVKYLADLGYTEFVKEGILIDDWPVQFLPITDALEAEAVRTAMNLTLKDKNSKVKARTIRPEYLVAICLKVGRFKDHLRIFYFVTQKAVNLTKLKKVLVKFNLQNAWLAFCDQKGLRNDLIDFEE